MAHSDCDTDADPRSEPRRPYEWCVLHHRVVMLLGGCMRAPRVRSHSKAKATPTQPDTTIGATLNKLTIMDKHDTGFVEKHSEAPVQTQTCYQMVPDRMLVYRVRPILALDLDGTLVDTTCPGTRPGEPSFTVDGRYETRLRPGLHAFLMA